MWIGQTEGAKFWLQVMGKLQEPRHEDILIANRRRLEDFPEAMQVFPGAIMQTIRAAIGCSMRTTGRRTRPSP